MTLYPFAELAARPIVKAKLKYSCFLSANLQIFPWFGAMLVNKGLDLAVALTLYDESHKPLLIQAVRSRILQQTNGH